MSFTTEQIASLASLAEKARKEAMGCATQERFEEFLNEAVLAYSSDYSIAPRQRRKLVAQARAHAQRLRGAMVELSLAGSPTFDTPWVTIAALDRIIAQHDRVGVQPGRPPGGRPASDGRFEAFVFLLGRAWRTATGRQPGVTSESGTNRKRGPFVEFVETALHYLEADTEQGNIGDKVNRALREIRSAGVDAIE